MSNDSFERGFMENLVTGAKAYFLFNPNEYTITKQNNWEAKDAKGTNVPKTKFKSGGAEQIKLSLIFDNYGQSGDVRELTEPMWEMMMISKTKKNPKNNKSEPPRVAFQWGKFYFEAVIMNLSQKFTMFDMDGTPQRCTMDVTLQQVEDKQEHHGQNPSSGGGPAMKTHIVKAGERLDLIASTEYGDPFQWRLIAQANNIRHPLQLKDGMQLIIPPLE